MSEPYLKPKVGDRIIVLTPKEIAELVLPQYKDWVLFYYPEYLYPKYRGKICKVVKVFAKTEDPRNISVNMKVVHREYEKPQIRSSILFKKIA